MNLVVPQETVFLGSPLQCAPLVQSVDHTAPDLEVMGLSPTLRFSFANVAVSG